MNIEKNIDQEIKGLIFKDGDVKLSLTDFKAQIVPIGNKVLIKKLSSHSPEYVKRSLIVIAHADESSENKFMFGVVLAIGDKVTTFKSGDYVIYGKWAGIELNASGDKYSIVKEEEISTKVIF